MSTEEEKPQEDSCIVSRRDYESGLAEFAEIYDIIQSDLEERGLCSSDEAVMLVMENYLASVRELPDESE